MSFSAFLIAGPGRYATNKGLPRFRFSGHGESEVRTMTRTHLFVHRQRSGATRPKRPSPIDLACKGLDVPPPRLAEPAGELVWVHHPLRYSWPPTPRARLPSSEPPQRTQSGERPNNVGRISPGRHTSHRSATRARPGRSAAQHGSCGASGARIPGACGDTKGCVARAGVC
jgi:hypothetical protein